MSARRAVGVARAPIDYDERRRRRRLAEAISDRNRSRNSISAPDDRRTTSGDGTEGRRVDNRRDVCRAERATESLSLSLSQLLVTACGGSADECSRNQRRVSTTRARASRTANETHSIAISDRLDRYKPES